MSRIITFGVSVDRPQKVAAGSGERPWTLQPRSYVVITLDRRQDHASLSDGYSVTANLYEPRVNASGAVRARRGLDADMGGCLHEIVGAVAPGLAPLIRVHLADLDGTPMHAEANAGYFYRGEHVEYETRNYGADYVQRHGSSLERAARVLRADPADMPADMSRAAFAAFVADQRERWRWDAHDADALMAALPGSDGLRGYDMRGRAVELAVLPAGILADGVRVEL